MRAIVCVLCILLALVCYADEAKLLIVNGNLLLPVRPTIEWLGGVYTEKVADTPQRIEISLTLNGKKCGMYSGTSASEPSEAKGKLLTGYCYHGVWYHTPAGIMRMLPVDFRLDAMTHKAIITNLATAKSLEMPVGESICTSGDPLHVAVQANDLVKIRKLLDANPGVVNSFDDATVRTPLSWAVRLGNADCVKLLLQCKADPNFGDTPLCGAVELGDSALVQLLLANGAKVDGRYIYRPLGTAARLGRKAIAEMLLNKNADVDAATPSDVTPLKEAVLGKQRSMIELLAMAGAKINMAGKDGRTALHYSVYCGDETITELLLNLGADIDAKDAEGTTTLALAKQMGKTAIIELLKKRGAKE